MGSDGTPVLRSSTEMGVMVLGGATSAPGTAPRGTRPRITLRLCYARPLYHPTLVLCKAPVSPYGCAMQCPRITLRLCYAMPPYHPTLLLPSILLACRTHVPRPYPPTHLHVPAPPQTKSRENSAWESRMSFLEQQVPPYAAATPSPVVTYGSGMRCPGICYALAMACPSICYAICYTVLRAVWGYQLQQIQARAAEYKRKLELIEKR
eukprot:3932586-Rhodomonas_salina.3